MPGRAYRRSRKDQLGRFEFYGKYEPRFKPPREKTNLGTSLKFDYLPLGGYDVQSDAEIAYQIAAFYYGKGEGHVKLEDGSHFGIPPMSEQERGLSGEDKVKWVSAAVKKVYAEIKSEEAARTTSNILREYSEPELGAQSFLDALLDLPEENFNSEIPSLDDVLNDEFIARGGTTTSLSTDDVAHHGFQRTQLPQNPDVLDCREAGSHALADVPDSFASGSDFNTKQENLFQLLLNSQKEQLEAEFNRWLSEQLSQQHQQHLQNQRLEERILALQRENEDLKSTLHQVV